MSLPGADPPFLHGLVFGGVSGGEVLEESIVWSGGYAGLNRVSLHHGTYIEYDGLFF